MKPMTTTVIAVAALALAGCEDKAKLSEQKAGEALSRLVPVMKEDVAQVRRGLPEGSKKLGTLLQADPGADLAGLQRAIAATRADNRDLNVAKSTFFTFVDTAGIAVKSEADPDVVATRSVVGPFPELKKALEPGAGVVETFGDMPELRGVKSKPDHQWLVAHPVKDPGGEVKGMFLTGWSFPRYAQVLEDVAKRNFMQSAQTTGDKTVPLVYVFVLKGNKAYGAPLTPDVNAEATEKLDLAAKTASGSWRGTVEVTGRVFGVAAERVSDLAPDAALAVLVSEI
jgi:hypothetical protein